MPNPNLQKTPFHVKIPKDKQIEFDYEKILLLKLMGCKNGWIFCWSFFFILVNMEVDWFHARGLFKLLTETQNNSLTAQK